MMSGADGPRNLWNRLMHLAFGLLAISVAITLAIHLLESVWVELVIIGVIALVGVVIHQIHRIRQSRW